MTAAAIRRHNQKLLSWLPWLPPEDVTAILKTHRTKPLGGKCGAKRCTVCGKWKLVERA